MRYDDVELTLGGGKLTHQSSTNSQNRSRINILTNTTQTPEDMDTLDSEGNTLYIEDGGFDIENIEQNEGNGSEVGDSVESYESFTDFTLGEDNVDDDFSDDDGTMPGMVRKNH